MFTKKSKNSKFIWHCGIFIFAIFILVMSGNLPASEVRAYVDCYTTNDGPTYRYIWLPCTGAMGYTVWQCPGDAYTLGCDEEGGGPGECMDWFILWDGTGDCTIYSNECNPPEDLDPNPPPDEYRQCSYFCEYCW